MGIDAKRIGLCLWKCLKLPITTSSRYPFVSGALISVFLLCIFLPSAFIIVACSSPFLALIAVLVRVCSKSKSSKSKNVKVVSIKDDDIIIRRNDGTAISRQMSRRRNFKDKNKPGWGARSKRDDLVLLTGTSIRDLLGLTPEIEDKPKVLLEVNKIGSLDDKNGSNAKEVLVTESLWKPDFTSHSSSDEQRHPIGGKVEIEDRHKRLETLIAKRRARKLARLQDGESPVGADMDNAPWPELEVAPILVSRANRFDTLMPGSALPVLLPSPNPFDLPYDPHEERPNLREDSFHEEFTVTKSKDKFLCRHESFSLGSFFKLEPKKAGLLGYPRCKVQSRGRSMSPKLSTQDPVEEEQAPIQERSTFPKLSTQDPVEEEQAPIQETNPVQLQQEEDNETDDITTLDQLEGVESSQNVESGLSKQSKVEIKTDTKHRESSASSSSSSASDSSDEDHIYNANIAGVSVSLTSKGRNFPNMIHSVKRPLACSIPKKKDDSSLSAADKAKREEFFYLGKSHHAHSHSLASDMQVELSDDGSPRPIVNEAFASDGDGEKDTNSGGEDMWGPSTSSVGGIEKQQLTSGEVHVSGEEAITEVTEISEKGQPDLKESDESQNVAEKTSSVDNPGTLTEKIPRTKSSIVHDLNETVMSQIMNEEKLQSVEHGGELESKALMIQEPVPVLVTDVQELSSRTVGGVIEAESQHSSDSVQSVNGEPSLVEERIPEPSTFVVEAHSKTTKNVEDESN